MSEQNVTLGDVHPASQGFYIGNFGGKPRYIKFDLNAFAEMEKIYGDMDKVNEVLQKNSIRDIRTILWLGLIWDEAILDPVTGEPTSYRLTQHQVGSWLDTSNMKTVVAGLSKAMGAAMPQDEINKPAAVQAAAISQHALAAAGDEPSPNK